VKMKEWKPAGTEQYTHKHTFISLHSLRSARTNPRCVSPSLSSAEREAECIAVSFFRPFRVIHVYKAADDKQTANFSHSGNR
jgi:hypothetical protein